MIICKNCGVELESDMQSCPLCTQNVDEEPAASTYNEKILSKEGRRMTQPQRRETWEIVSIVILLVMVVTSLLNIILNREISWAQYPLASCIVLFTYITVFAFTNTKWEIQLLYVFIISSVLIYMLDFFTLGLSWSIHLGIPLLFFVNILLIAMRQIYRRVKRKGINLIAFAFIAAALLCLFTEALIDFYMDGIIRLVWSLIVVGCVLPIVIFLLYMHIRLNKGTDLQRTFHI
jgi:fatty acid desaturase